MSNKYELEQLVKNEICYEHNTDRRSPYYDEYVFASTKGAVDIELDKATKRSFTFYLHFRDVSEKFAISWCEKYFSRFNMHMRNSTDTEESEKGWFIVIASIPTEEICKYYNMEYE